MIKIPSEIRKTAFRSTMKMITILYLLKLVPERGFINITRIRKFTEAYHFEYNGKTFPSHYRMVAHHFVRLEHTLKRLHLLNKWPSGHSQKKYMSKYYKRWR